MNKEAIVLWIFLFMMGFALSYGSVKLAAASIRVEFEQHYNALPNATTFYDREGQVLATFSGDERRRIVPLSDIDIKLQQAVVAIEDHRFFEHSGIDIQRVLAAILANLKSLSYEQGGSTITQQLVKLTLLSPERSIFRKIKEAFISLSLETAYSKEQLLEFYLNKVYMGNGIHGVEMASRMYFKRSVKDLSLAQASLLAAIIKKPSGYFKPARDFWEQSSKPILASELEQLSLRQRLVLTNMLRNGWANRMAVRNAGFEPTELYKPVAEFLQTKAPYFVQSVIKRLREALDVDSIIGKGYHVYTTLDMRLQELAEQELAEAYVQQSGAEQQAMVVINPADGNVLTLVGGRDYSVSQFNRAIQAYRPTGSAFKPIVYATALEYGYQVNSTFIDSPMRYIRDENQQSFAQHLDEEGRIIAETRLNMPSDASTELTQFPQGIIDSYQPENYGKIYGMRLRYPNQIGDLPRERRMTLMRALERSSNSITVKLLANVGLTNIADYASKFNLSVDPQTGLCIALGCSENNLLNLTMAYSVFANDGQLKPAVFISEVKDSSGNVIYKKAARGGERVISKWVASQLLDMLQNVVKHGTGRRADIGGAVAGKTGTSDDSRDAWFVGMTPSLLAGVWLGNDDNSIIPNESGGRTPATVWRNFMIQALEGDNEEHFHDDEEYLSIRTCEISGQHANEWCPVTNFYHYRLHEAPGAVCALHYGPFAAAPVPSPDSYAYKLGQAFALPKQLLTKQ